MARRGTALVFLLILGLCSPAGARSAHGESEPGRAPDALPIIQQAFEAAKKNYAIARNYVFYERVEERRYTKKGKLKKQESRTHDVTLLDHSEYRRLIAINDRPLYPETEAKEQRKLERHIREMQEETPKQRKKRMAKVEREREQTEEFLGEITRAFDFTVIGEEQLDGVVAHVISLEPREGYAAPNREAKVLPKVRGTVWIAKDDYGWVQLELETIGNIRWAVVFKLRKGAQIRFRQRKLNDEVWLTDSWSAHFRANATFMFKMNAEFSGRYTNFRKFTTQATEIHGEAPR